MELIKKFKVGDKCQIRRFEEMAGEYGLSITGNIPCEGGLVFASGMKYLCGKPFTIKRIQKDGYFYRCWSEEGIEDQPCHWIISMSMLEPLGNNAGEFEAASIEQLISML